jgi:hypothetical protein
LSPISLMWRSSVMSVCVKDWRCVKGIDEEKISITVFFANASARCCAPTAPIRFQERSNVGSAYVKSEYV